MSGRLALSARGVPFAAAWLAALMVALGTLPGHAQTSPLTVNDCTLLPDPGALRRCLDQAEGRLPATQMPPANPAPTERPAQEAQSSASVGASVRPNAPQPDFLSDKPARNRETRPAKRNVIDLQ